MWLAWEWNGWIKSLHPWAAWAAFTEGCKISLQSLSYWHWVWFRWKKPKVFILKIPKMGLKWQKWGLSDPGVVRSWHCSDLLWVSGDWQETNKRKGLSDIHTPLLLRQTASLAATCQLQQVLFIRRTFIFTELFQLWWCADASAQLWLGFQPIWRLRKSLRPLCVCLQQQGLWQAASQIRPELALIKGTGTTHYTDMIWLTLSSVQDLVNGS